jgi:hypothetical protein
MADTRSITIASRTTMMNEIRSIMHGKPTMDDLFHFVESVEHDQEFIEVVCPYIMGNKNRIVDIRRMFTRRWLLVIGHDHPISKIFNGGEIFEFDKRYELSDTAYLVEDLRHLRVSMWYPRLIIPFKNLDSIEILSSSYHHIANDAIFHTKTLIYDDDNRSVGLNNISWKLNPGMRILNPRSGTIQSKSGVRRVEPEEITDRSLRDRWKKKEDTGVKAHL